MKPTTPDLISGPHSSVTRPEDPSTGIFSVPAFLYALGAEPTRDPDPATLARLERLCKKIDVARRVRSLYEADLVKPVSDDSLSLGYQQLLLGILLHYAAVSDDAKFLNSSLKLMDQMRKRFGRGAVASAVAEAADRLLAGYG